MRKICPFMLIAFYQYTGGPNYTPIKSEYCIEENCAMYNSLEKRCGMVNMQNTEKNENSQLLNG